jgi:hypothetical protein
MTDTYGYTVADRCSRRRGMSVLALAAGDLELVLREEWI